LQKVLRSKRSGIQPSPATSGDRAMGGTISRRLQRLCEFDHIHAAPEAECSRPVRAVDFIPRFGLYSYHLVPTTEGALRRRSKCGDDRRVALEMRRKLSGIGAATSAAIGAVAWVRVRSPSRRPKPCGPGAAAARHGIGGRNVLLRHARAFRPFLQRWIDAEARIKTGRHLKRTTHPPGVVRSKPQTPRAERRGTGTSVVTTRLWTFYLPSTGPWGASAPPALRAPSDFV
jgi:hypothetical protein